MKHTRVEATAAQIATYRRRLELMREPYDVQFLPHCGRIVVQMDAHARHLWAIDPDGSVVQDTTLSDMRRARPVGFS